MNSKTWNVSKVFLMMIVAATFGGMLLLNCKGDDGAVGPMGNANVIYSEWVYATGFNDSVSDNSNVKVGYIKDSLITDSVMNYGVVFMYMNYGAGPMQLPYTSYAGGKASTISFWLKPGKLIPYRFTHDNSNGVNLSTLLKYRYIIIPANVSDSVARANANGRVASSGVAGLDYSDYSAVCKYYGIKE